MSEFVFEESLWELTLSKLRSGGSFSAVRFLALMEGEDESSVEDALMDLEQRKITLDISDLPKAAGTGEAAVRLRREVQLAKSGMLISALEENDPLGCIWRSWHPFRSAVIRIFWQWKWRKGRAVQQNGC